jgi:GWxTD domain-containing protein
MNRVLLFLLLCGYYLQAQQPLQNINYNYLYLPERAFSFSMDVFESTKDSVGIVYQLTLHDTTLAGTLNKYLISWEMYSSLGSKEAQALYPSHQFVTTRQWINGTFKLPKTNTVLAAKVINADAKIAWYYFKPLDLMYPSDGYLVDSAKTVLNKVQTTGETVYIQGRHSINQSIVYFYQENFPAATPAFAEEQTAVSAVLKPDSTLVLKDNSFKTFANGLYLIQSDSLAKQGIALLTNDDYPKYRKLENLVGPLTYITTKNEYDRLKNSVGDKKSFDKMIIGITGNTERAKNFMRNYYKRVELANRFFTSYKEGWKTDRGMIYITFGLPNAVYKFSDREVWEYEGAFAPKISFTFVRSSSIFDPDNFVLIRKRSYQDTWLQVIDLIRSARF